MLSTVSGCDSAQQHGSRACVGIKYSRRIRSSDCIDTRPIVSGRHYFYGDLITVRLHEIGRGSYGRNYIMAEVGDKVLVEVLEGVSTAEFPAIFAVTAVESPLDDCRKSKPSEAVIAASWPAASADTTSLDTARRRIALDVSP